MCLHGVRNTVGSLDQLADATVIIACRMHTFKDAATKVKFDVEGRSSFFIHIIPRIPVRFYYVLVSLMCLFPCLKAHLRCWESKRRHAGDIPNAFLLMVFEQELNSQNNGRHIFRFPSPAVIK